MTAAHPPRGVRAQARIEFVRAPSGASHVARQQVGYPFHLGRSLQLPDDPPGMAAVYLQSCSGGIFAGEDIHLSLRAAHGSQAHVTTGAATIAHSMLEQPAWQTVTLEAQTGALLEYLPMATILFPRSRLHSRIEVTLHPGARVMLCDTFTMHAPAGEGGAFDGYRASLEVRRADGFLLAGDRLYVRGADMLRGIPGVNGPARTLATFMILDENLPARALSETLRARMPFSRNAYLGVSSLPNDCGLSVRVAATDAPALGRALHAIWAVMRERLTGTSPRVRRSGFGATASASLGPVDAMRGSTRSLVG